MSALRPSRRSFLKALATLIMTPHPMTAMAETATVQGRLQARPGTASASQPSKAGLHPLGLGDGRDGLLYVPEQGAMRRPMPLVVMLHGAGGVAAQVVPMVQAQADQRGILVLAPDSRSRSTWDIIRGDYGPDVQFIDRALSQVFERFPVDPARIAIGGFSDGASYALSLGLMNGDVVHDILAFSPGFAALSQTTGRPRIFISHGDSDEVLPVERCGRRLARELSRAGYDVDYREFAGGHVVPPEMVGAALGRFSREARQGRD
jgi:phospholipase/carboxylesterase